MKDLNTSALLAMDLALKNASTRSGSVAGAQAVWRWRLRVRWGARERARAGAFAVARLRDTLLPVVALGARGRMRADAIAPRRVRARARALLRGRPAPDLDAAGGPESEPEQWPPAEA